MTGKAELGAASRLCKQSLFRMFYDVVDKLPRPGTLPDNAKTELYSVLKSKAEDYQVLSHLINFLIWHLKHHTTTIEISKKLLYKKLKKIKTVLKLSIKLKIKLNHKIKFNTKISFKNLNQF